MAASKLEVPISTLVDKLIYRYFLFKRRHSEFYTSSYIVQHPQ